LSQARNRDSSGSRLLDWSLAVGGGICLGIGILVLAKGQQPLASRSFMALISVSMVTMGIGNLLEPSLPLLSSRFKFIAKTFLGLAILSFSWGLSHS
jgi:hypothetical protein